MAMSGFLMAVSSWNHLLQCIVIVLSFLRLLKLRKLAVCKLDLSRGGSYSVLQCVRPWVKFTPEYPFNFYLIATAQINSFRFQTKVKACQTELCVMAMLRTIKVRYFEGKRRGKSDLKNDLKNS